MERIATLPDGTLIATQLQPADLDVLAARGVRSVINNRPDGEAPDQPAAAVLEAQCRALGLGYAFLPFASGVAPDPATTLAFAGALARLPQPVAAFCRTGTRSITLWAFAQVAGGASVQATLAASTAAGFDLAKFSPQLAATALA
jgi:sulfide:quinone oxidoreductase